MDLHFFCSYYDKTNLSIDIGRDSNIPFRVIPTFIDMPSVVVVYC